MLHLVITVLISLLLAATQAIADTTITQGRLLDVQPQSQVLHQTRAEVNSYLIALGKYRRSRGLWVPEEFLRKAGTLQRLTLELPEYYTEQEAFDHYKNQLPDSSQVLFECSARDCGESNNWANMHFRVKQLYGQNASQLYGVYSWVDAEDDSKINYLTLYTVRRGNDRLYTQVDVFWAE